MEKQKMKNEINSNEKIRLENKIDSLNREIEILENQCDESFYQDKLKYLKQEIKIYEELRNKLNK
jgi:predicted  nucleic acid-binding Zn-ribbon protein